MTLEAQGEARSAQCAARNCLYLISGPALARLLMWHGFRSSGRHLSRFEASEGAFEVRGSMVGVQRVAGGPGQRSCHKQLADIGVDRLVSIGFACLCVCAAMCVRLLTTG